MKHQRFRIWFRRIALTVGLLGSGVGALAAARLEHQLSPSTQLTIESAPLALASRAFARVEALLDDAFETEQFATKFDQRLSVESAILHQASQIAGVQKQLRLEPIDDPSRVSVALMPLAKALSLSPNGEDPATGETLHRLEMGVSALIRSGTESSGVRVYLARTRAADETRVLVLVDDETSEMLLLALRSPTL